MTTGLLDQELATYEAHRDELLGKATGKFVLIKGDRIVDIFENPIDATKRGYEEFGSTPFFVKEIVEIEIPANFTSFLLAI